MGSGGAEGVQPAAVIATSNAAKQRISRMWPLTVKLRGRAEAPALGAEGAKILGARGARPQAHHGAVQRLFEAVAHGVRDTLRTTTLPYQVLSTRLEQLPYAAMISAGMLVNFPVEERSVSALSRGSDSARFKFV
jgi:hypothetical protein